MAIDTVLRNIQWARYSVLIGLAVSMVWIQGCTFGGHKDYDETSVPDEALISTWAAKGQWLLADVRWHQAMIEQIQQDQKGDKSHLATHERLLDNRKQELDNLLKEMKWGSLRLRQTKNYQLARSLEKRTERLQRQANPPSAKARAQAASARRSAQATAKGRIDQEREALLLELDEQLSERNFSEVNEIFNTLSNSPYALKNPDPRVLKAQTALKQESASLDRSATQAYRLGQVKDAIELWRQALEYDPDNVPVAQKLQRAQRVAEKLDAIRSSN
jgi:tetratricopeptide (TPR) repeat protein